MNADRANWTRLNGPGWGGRPRAESSVRIGATGPPSAVARGRRFMAGSVASRASRIADPGRQHRRVESQLPGVATYSHCRPQAEGGRLSLKAVTRSGATAARGVGRAGDAVDFNSHSLWTQNPEPGHSGKRCERLGFARQHNFDYSGKPAKRMLSTSRSMSSRFTNMGCLRNAVSV